MKYPLTGAAKVAAKYLVDRWDAGSIQQLFTLTDQTAADDIEFQTIGGLGILDDSFVTPTISLLMELSKFQLIYVGYDDATGWDVLLMQELRNAVESGFEVSEYFLTINAVGTIIQAGATVTAPFQSAAVGYGSLTQTQTAENNQLAEKLMLMLGKQFLESNGEIVKAISEFRESTESDRQSKLGNVISQLGNSLQHGANAIVVSQALMYLAPFISQIIT